MHIRTVLLLCVAVLPVRADDAKDVPKNKDLAALQGIWKLEGVEGNGIARDVPAKPPRWVIEGNKVFYGGAELAELTIDGAANPKSVDLGFVSPKRTFEGVYALDKDTLKICVNAQTEGVKERPLNFETEGKADWRLFFFKREPKDVDPNEGLNGFVGIQISMDAERMLVLIGGLIDDGPAKKAGLMIAHDGRPGSRVETGQRGGVPHPARRQGAGRQSQSRRAAVRLPRQLNDVSSRRDAIGPRRAFESHRVSRFI